MNLPTDTIIDTDDSFESMGEEFCDGARELMKALYLAHPMADTMRGQGFTNTEIVDAAEGLRRKGFIKIISHGYGPDDTYQIVMTNPGDRIT